MNRAQRRAEEKQPVSQTACSQQEVTLEHIPLRSGEATELQLLWACREVFDTAGLRSTNPAESVWEKRF